VGWFDGWPLGFVAIRVGLAVGCWVGRVVGCCVG
jgi:hypothetical protein